MRARVSPEGQGVWAVALENEAGPIAIDAFRLLSARARKAFVEALPEGNRENAAELLSLAAAECVGAQRSKRNADSGRPVHLKSPELWEEPVDGAALLADLMTVFSDYLRLRENGNVVLALWTLHAHTHAAATHSPILALLSPVRRCGKSVALDVLSCLVPRPVSACNISPAAVFRLVEHRPTLLIDELDSFLKGDNDLINLLNSGHRPTGYVYRVEGDDREVREFSVWAPKAVAMIGKLPPTVEDRAIVVPMKRKRKGESTEPVRVDRVAQRCEKLLRKAARWGADHGAGLREADPDVPIELNDRAQDNWRPLLAIAELIGGCAPTLARETARAFSVSEGLDLDGEAGTLLLGDIRGLFVSEQTDRFWSDGLVKALLALQDRPWAELNNGRPLSQHRLARMLREYDVRPDSVRIGNETKKGYLREWFADSFSHYLPIEPEPEQITNGADPHGSRAVPVPDRRGVEDA